MMENRLIMIKMLASLPNDLRLDTSLVLKLVPADDANIPL